MRLLYCFYCIAPGVSGQNHFAAERMYVNIPSSQTASSAGIAAYINSHYQTDEKKIAAIYSWITANIKYDADSIHYVILDDDNEERVSWALRRKRGVCENFAAIFTDVANQMRHQFFCSARLYQTRRKSRQSTSCMVRGLC